MSQTLAFHVMLDTEVRARMLDNWSRLDKWVRAIASVSTLALAVVLTVTYSYVAGFFGTLAGVLIWIVMLSRGKKAYFRVYYLLFIMPIRRMLLKRKKYNWWVAGDKPVIPLKLDYVEAKNLDDETKMVSLTHHRDTKQDQLYVKVYGARFASRSSSEQLEYVQELAQIMNKSLSESLLKAGIASLRVMAPHNPHPYHVWLNEHGDPVVYDQESFSLSKEEQEESTEAFEYELQLQQTMAANAQTDNWELFVVTFKRTREWSKALKGQLTSEELNDLPVIQLGENLVQSLKKSTIGFGDVHVLKPHELFLLNRASWDVYGIDEFYKTYSSIVSVYENDPDLMVKLHEKLSCWPEVIMSSKNKDCIQVDKNWISFVRVTGTKQQMLANQVFALHTSTEPDAKMWLRHYNGGEALSGSRETNTLWMNETFVQNMEKAFFSKAVIEHPDFGKKKKAMHDKTQLASNHSIAQLYNDFWAVVCPDYRTSRARTERLVAELKSREYKAEVVKDRMMHKDLLLTTTLGASRV